MKYGDYYAILGVKREALLGAPQGQRGRLLHARPRPPYAVAGDGNSIPTNVCHIGRT